MNYYDRNLEVIKNKKIKLLNGITNYKNEKSSYSIEIASCPTKDGNNTVLVTIDGHQYRLNSSYQPLKEAEKWASTFTYQNIDNMTSMFGLGNGLFLRELIRKKNETDKVLVYEPCPEIFLHVLENYDLTDILENDMVSITVAGMNDNQFKNELEQVITWSNVETQIVCMHPQYEKMFLPEVKTFLTIVSENNSSTLINRNTVAYFSRDVIENTLKNLRYIKDANTILDLVGVIPQDVPAIIVSAGPSLDKNIELLKQAKGKAVIVATDTAMRFLYAHDIVPDFCVTLDAMKPASYMDDPRYMEVPLFTKVESNWRILRKHKARKIFYNCQDYMTKLFEKAGIRISNYESGGSVATGAFSICAALRFKTIILIGQDLSYEGDRTHAGSLTDRIRGEEEGIRYVEGYYGGKVKTRHDWYIYLKWFEQAIEEVSSFLTVIDATEGGAMIHGSVNMSLQEAIERYCVQEVNCEEIIANRPKTLSEEELKKVYGYITDGIKEFEMINTSAQRAKKLCEQILSKLKNNSEFTDQLMRKAQELTDINSIIEESLVYNLVNEYVAELTVHVLKDIYKFTEDEDENRINTFKRAKAFYEAIIASVSAISPMLQDTIDSFWNTEDSIKPDAPKRIVLEMKEKEGASGTEKLLLKQFFGKTMLEHMVDRIRQSKLIDDFVIVTSIYEQDDDIVELAQRLGIKTFRGSDDLLSGHYYAAKDNRADIVVRITLNSLLVDPELIDNVIQFYQSNSYSLVTNTMNQEDNTFPKGLEVEVFSADVLRTAYQYAKELYQRQQVTAYIYEKGNIGIYKNTTDVSDYNWTIDAEESLRFLTSVYERLYHGKHDFYYKEVLDFIHENPELIGPGK